MTTSYTVPRQVARSALHHFIANNALILVLYGSLLVAFVGLSIASPTFRSGPNLWTLARQAVIPGMIGIAQTIIIISGGIDLSVGSLVTFISLVSAGLMNGRPELFIPVAALMLFCGVLVGFAHGLVVKRGYVPPFITTLGTALVLQGAGLAYATVPKGGVPIVMGDLFYYGTLGPVPYPVILFLVVLILAVLLMSRTGFGRAVYAVGGNPEVAHRSGIKVMRTQIIVFCLGSFLVAVAALVATARMGIGDPMAGMGMELDSITAVVIGGTSLFGGRGNLFGTIAGVIIMTLINNVMVNLGVNVFYQQLIKGFVVLLVVALYKQRA
ncbi:MAG: ABC transporter permease [Desulfobacterales bacterium]|nr:MAG: ABC transporter permease [Desulfobacterales bacterium]